MSLHPQARATPARVTNAMEGQDRGRGGRVAAVRLAGASLVAMRQHEHAGDLAEVLLQTLDAEMRRLLGGAGGVVRAVGGRDVQVRLGARIEAARDEPIRFAAVASANELRGSHRPIEA